MKHLEFDIYLQKMWLQKCSSRVNAQCVDYTKILAPSSGIILNYFKIPVTAMVCGVMASKVLIERGGKIFITIIALVP